MHVVSQFDHCEKKTSQIATTSSPAALTRLDNLPRVATAPSTERPRLMALRSAAGESWRSVGRPDEGATGSVHFVVGSDRQVRPLDSRLAQIARSSFCEMLDPRAV